MSVITNNLLLGEDGYNISRSVRLRSSASAYFSRTPAGAGNQQKWTWSGWAKRGSFGQQQLFGAGAGTGGSPECYIDFEDNLNFQIFDGTSNLAVVRSTAVYRDPSAWYHVVVSVDTTQATAANRVLLYINGQAITSFAFSTYPTQNLSTQVNAATAHRISSSTRTNAYYFDGYLTEVNFIDGQALTPSSFGETDSITGVWKPKKYAGTYGTNGFFLNFSDNSSNTATTIGKDYSGNGNNWTPNNISVTSGVTYDSMLDVPTMWADGGNGRGNYCVINPLNKGSGTVSDGNLSEVIPAASGTAGKGAGGTIAASSGKWYAEFVATANSNYAVGVMGMDNTTQDIFTSGVGYYALNGQKYVSGTNTSYGATYTTNDVIGVALDIDGGTVTFYKNNTSQGAITLPSLPSGGWRFHVSNGTSLNTQTYVANFGQRPFAYTPPTGFKALNTQNLPDATIKAGNKFFDATTYTGTGATLSVTNSGSMQPDLVWIKDRSAARSHRLFDAVRGATKGLFSDATDAETTLATDLTAFNSNGFTLGVGLGSNASTETFVGWQWKESASAGFDIVTYTGTGVARTVSHSLGVAPAMMIIKNRTSAVDWLVYHTSLGNTNYAVLNTTAAAATNAAAWNNTSPTSSVFTVGTGTSVNQNTNSHVAYLFAEVAGFSKFGSYTGNGSTDGPMVWCGFQPRFIMIKRTDTTSNWVIWDTARDTYNAGGLGLYPNLSAAEDDYRSSNPDDILSNGFKPRANYANVNASGGTYIFAAFASVPFKHSLAR